MNPTIINIGVRGARNELTVDGFPPFPHLQDIRNLRGRELRHVSVNSQETNLERVTKPA
jgi:hypothetical protein